MSEMTEHQVIIQFIEGLKMSASSARMLGTMQRNSDFLGIAMILDEISKNGARLATSKSMNATVLEKALGRFSEVAGNG